MNGAWTTGQAAAESDPAAQRIAGGAGDRQAAAGGSGDERLRDYLKRVTVELHDTRARLNELQAERAEPIAIVGIGCRYPGGIESSEDLWSAVRAGVDTVAPFPEDRGWDLERLYDPDPDRPGTTYVRESSFLEDLAGFDAAFFSISPREAQAMDPQQRLLLEASWQALEDAAIDPLSLHGSRAGVFVGAAANGYGAGCSAGDGHYGSGTLTSIASGRVAYTLGLEGPAITVDTACSSSLVALHLACVSLRAGESSLALVGGVNAMPTPVVFVELARQRGLASDGRCKAYADAADGTGWSEGVGVLVLERISDALRSGRRILATVRGSAVNQDGASNGLTAPNGPSQRRVIEAALASAGLRPRDVDAVEGHGTGTRLGDPIEAQALLLTYGRDRPATDRPLWLGSIKSNIGHSQAAAGVAGVIKLAMALRHELLPKTLHVDRPSTQVDWDAGAVSLLLDHEPWPRRSEPRRGAVSSFGASGTNAHAILEEPPIATKDAGLRSPRGAARDGQAAARPPLRGVSALAFSAREEPALDEQAGRLRARLAAEPRLRLADAGLTLARRSVFEHRAVAIAEKREDLLAGLSQIAAGAGADEHSVRGVVAPEGPGGVVFVFPGQGSQWRGMAGQLMRGSDVFAESFGECADALSPFLDWSPREALQGASGAPSLERVDVVQPVLFAVMVALARLWMACGVRPDAVVGHSQGEIAAAHVAGALSLEDAARVVALRSSALTALAGRGGMVSLALALDPATALLEQCSGALSVAAVNGPGTVVVSGELGALEELAAVCEQRDIRLRRIAVDYAAHSQAVEEIRERLLEGCAAVRPRPAEIPFYSTVTGSQLDAAELNAEYWYRNLRQTVRLSTALGELFSKGHRTFVEVSPHPVLALATLETIERESGSAAADVGVHPTLRRGEGDARRFLRSLAEVWVRGVGVDWEAQFAGATPTSIPTYPFQRRRHWLESADGAGDPGSLGQHPAGHPLFGAEVSLADGEGSLLTGRVALQRHPWLADHKVAGLVVVPGTTFVELALRAGRELGCELVEDLVFENPLVLGERSAAVQLQATVGAVDADGRRSIAIHTRPERESSRGSQLPQPAAHPPTHLAGHPAHSAAHPSTQPAGRPDRSPWICNARGTLAPAPAEPSQTELQAAGFAASWPPADAEPLDPEDLYDYFAELGLCYGPAFLSVRAAWQRGDEAFAEVTLPDDQHSLAADFGVHPALLDCALQAGGVLMRTAGDASPASPILPFAWSRVRLHAAGRASLRVRVARLQQGGMSLVAADEHGQAVLSAESVVVRKVSAEQLRGLGAYEHESLLRADWVSVGEADPSGSRPGDVGAAVVVLTALGGSAPDGHGSAWRSFADVGELAAALEDGMPAPAIVLAPVEGNRERGGNDDGDLPTALGDTLAAALSLVQDWLADERLSAVRLTIVTRDAVAAVEDDGVEDLAAASVWGLLRSVQSEHPGRFWLLDLDERTLAAPVVGALLDGREPQLAQRDGAALALRLRRVSLPAAPPVAPERSPDQPVGAPERSPDQSVGAPERSPDESVEVAERSPDRSAEAAAGSPEPARGIGTSRAGGPGTVLITGGTGALGALLARHLVERHGVRYLLLASRQGERAPGAERLREQLSELGASMSVASCDVTDRRQLRALIESIDRDAPLSAVVHAAGALDDGLIDSMTPERLERTLAPKAVAAWHLHELTEGLDLAAFVLFSSSTGTIGGPAQANYAAANAFLDALAAHRRRRGLAAVSMAWGLWGHAEGMMSGVGDAERERMERAGMLPMSAEQGLELFDAAYLADLPAIVPARLDLRGLRSRVRGGALPPLLRELVPASVARVTADRESLARRLAEAPEGERERIALELVRREVASVLGHESPHEIDVQRAFNELGFDSLTAVELRNRLSASCETQLPATLVFDYPTCSALADFLLAKLSGRLEGGGDACEDGEGEIREALADERIDEMDIESLVKLTLEQETVEEPGVRS